MSRSNINRHREALLFFPYVSLPRHLRKGLPPREALQEIFKALQLQGLYMDGRWTYEETFANKTPEDAVAQFFQTIQQVACGWANADSNTITTSWRDHSLHLIENLRNPDVILVPMGSKSDITFRDVLTYCELKESFSGSSQKEALKQLTEIAGHVSACQLNRRFYIASSLCNRKFTLTAFLRGSTVISEPTDIDFNPIHFLSAILGLSSASAAWCGFDFFMTPGPSNTYELNRSFRKFSKVTLGAVLLHAATDMQGKGTKVPLCEVWEHLGVAPKIYPIKMSWMATVLPGGNSSSAKLPNDIDIAELMAKRAPHFPTLQGQQKRIFGKEDEYQIFSNCLVSPTDGDAPTWDYTRHWPGITIVLHDECDTPLAPCPCPDPALWATGYYPDDYEPPMQQDTTRNILERFDVPVRIDQRKVDENWNPQDEDAIFTPPSLFGETREHTWVLYRSCGTSIVWFSCRRELVNGLLGALAGHFNALMLQILHCDISDANVMFKVKDASPDAVVPNWPQGEGAYPKRPGMLGDWGYSADLEENPIIRRITGTFPYMATDFLSSETRVLGHKVRHDLESFFWVLWVVCVNMNGPFYMRRRWQGEKRGSKNPAQSVNASTSAATSSSILTDSSISDVSNISYISNNSTATTEVTGSPTHIVSPLAINPISSSQTRVPLIAPNPEQELSQPPALPLQRQYTFREQPWREEQIITVTTRLPLGEEEPGKHAPPVWATPGRHNLGFLDVFHSKRTIPETMFLDCISPYFRQSGSGFLDGMKTLHTYFVKMQGPEGEDLKQKMGEITHEKFCEILKGMRDSIPADVDRTSGSDIAKARRRYKKLVKAGGSHGIAISVLDSRQRNSQWRKRPAEEQNDGRVAKKRAFKG